MPRNKGGKQATGRGTHLGAPTDGKVIAVPLRSQQTTRIRVRAFDQVVADGSGIAAFATVGVPIVSPCTWLSTAGACPVWQDLKLVYDEYRINSIRVRWTPVNRYNNSNHTGPMVLAFDADNIPTAPSSYAQVGTYTTAVEVSANDPFEVVWTVPQAAAAVWYDVNGVGSVATAQPGQFIMYSLNLDPSVNYGLLSMEMDISVRGVRQ